MRHFAIAAVLALVAAGCSSGSQELADATRERDALRARNAELERQVGELRAEAASKPAAAPKPAATPASAMPATSPPLAPMKASPYATAKPWVDDALQLRDAAKRDAAIAAIRDALASDDPARVAAGLVAVPQVSKVAYDKATVRPLVLRHAKSDDAAVRAAFPFALLNCGDPQPGDADLVLPLTSDPDPLVRGNAGRSLVFFTKYDLTGPAGERVLALLDDPDRRVRRDVLASIWGSRVSPDIEARLLAMFASDDHQARHDAFYFGLSTLRDKSPAVVDACISAMESPDAELQWRARWGLGQGVPDDQRQKVGDSYLRQLSARSDTQLEQDAFQWLSRYGTREHAAALEKLAENQLLSDETKKAALHAAATIRATR
jgi:hypothetical protein